MEDGAALAVVLPKGTSPEDVPERLRLYQQIRLTRAHAIQEYSRQAGKDRIPGAPPAVESKSIIQTICPTLCSQSLSEHLPKLQLWPR